MIISRSLHREADQQVTSRGLYVGLANMDASYWYLEPTANDGIIKRPLSLLLISFSPQIDCLSLLHNPNPITIATVLCRYPDH